MTADDSLPVTADDSWPVTANNMISFDDRQLISAFWQMMKFTEDDGVDVS